MLVFRGALASFGTTSGFAAVIASWVDSPQGAFVSAVCRLPDGRRILLAPTQAQADLVLAIHHVDEVRLETLDHVNPTPTSTRFSGPSLDITVTSGRSTVRGAIVDRIPHALKETRGFAQFTEVCLRVLSTVNSSLRHVHATGLTHDGRREYHCARGERILLTATGTFDGYPVGGIAPLPTCDFGFSDPPRGAAVGTMTALREA